MPDNRCSNCIAYNFQCSYIEAAKKRGPPKGYVESLEGRLEKMEKLLHRLYPDRDFSRELETGIDPEKWPIDGSFAVAMNPKNPGAALSPPELATSAIRTMASSISIPDEDDLGHLALSDNIRKLAIDEHAEQRFFGKSSGAMLIQTAVDLKHQFTGHGMPSEVRPGMMFASRRDEYWRHNPWETFSQDATPEYSFPETDLIASLVDLYFANFNAYFPLLHRPTFERSVAEGLHLKDDGFAAVVILVCANGARFSDDPRILLDGNDSYHSCGWKWFAQVQMVRKSLLTPPSLYDLQFHCLTVQFLQGSSAPDACWTMVGIGIRLAQDVGAHRRKGQNHRPTVEDEQWKRAFWVLVCMDRLVSMALGRPCAIQDEDFDLDLPLECDDEYWEHPDPEKAFKQPPDKPSFVAYFNCYLRLNQVLGMALRTVYAINKSKILLGFIGQQWEQHIVAELDSALNKWVDAVPDHLRWDPNREDPLHFNQSVALYSSYYHLQILIHRPFIPSPRKPSPLSFPSLAICTNAARSCSHIVDVQRHRTGVSQPHIQMAVFTAGIVLLLNIWGGKRSGLSTDPKKEMADVHKCMAVLKKSELRWITAGRLWDILVELASVGELPLPQPSPAPSNKREREEDSPVSSSATPPRTLAPEKPRHVAGSRRVSGKEPAHSSFSSMAPPPQTTQPQPQSSESSQSVFLPVYSEELARLPLRGQLSFSGRETHPGNPAGAYWYPPAPVIPDNQPSADPRSGHAAASSLPPPLSAIDQMLFEQMAAGVPLSYSQLVSPYQNTVEDMSGGMETLPPGYGPQGPYLAAGGGSLTQPVMDNDTMAMWSAAPAGFELDDWGQYLSNVSELTQGMHGGSDHSTPSM
ncbi:hypothetical protein HGRIS_004462 [Hohenbuehelia grisea]|uniref:Xylanolytic transcriptional activator regulatory domain-containing protein n=1 Tax=Hohenbuehelia grisea TaxID=104357 RepID=A0ABR3JCK5_9AGAR